MTELIRLSAIDHVLATENVSPMQFVLHYAGELDAGRVEEAFRATMRDFAGVSGTLVQLDAHNMALDLSRDRAEFRVVSPVDDLPLAACIDSVQTRPGETLARARITKLPGGKGTTLGFAMSHAVADGYGYFLFMAAWAARARGNQFPAPVCDRELLSRRDLTLGTGGVHPRGQLAQAGYFVMDAVTPPARLNWQERSVTVESLAAKGAGGDLSANDHISAVLWKDFLDDVQHDTTTLACAVDIRRHRPELGPLYFGNAVLLAAVTVTADALRKASAAEAAAWIRNAVDAVPPRIDAAIVELEGLRAREGLEVMTRLRGFEPDCGFLVTNLSRLPLDALDFGAGRPIDVEVASAAPRGRTCIVLPAGERLRLLIARP